MASWADDNGAINSSSVMRPGQVQLYMLHSVTIHGTTRQFALACVCWYKTDEESELFGKPMTVWREKDYVSPGPATFMPVQRINSTFAACSIKRNGLDKLVVGPIPRLFN